MACEYCELIEGKKPSHKLYEDDKVLCILADRPVTAGHIVVIPKQHAQIFEMLSDDIASHVMIIANKMSIALFESIKAQGTNIITQNGVPAGQEIPHFCVHVIARRENDGLMFEWLPKKLSDQEMGTIEMQLKEEFEEKNEPVPTEIPPPEIKETGSPKDAKEEKKDDKPKEESYLLRQLRRMP